MEQVVYFVLMYFVQQEHILLSFTFGWNQMTDPSSAPSRAQGMRILANLRDRPSLAFSKRLCSSVPLGYTENFPIRRESWLNSPRKGVSQ